MPIEVTPDYSQKIAKELHLTSHQVSATIDLLDSGSTVPFIARYRKEITGSLNETLVISIRDRLEQCRELDKRRVSILGSIEKQGKLTDELKEKILRAATMAVLEDLYLPYKPKRKTRATVAKEKGLEPLAALIFEQKGIDPGGEAQKYIGPKQGVESVAAALAGARDIIAEWISEDAQLRERLRSFFHEKAIMRSKIIKGKEEEAQKYIDYFDFRELAKTAPSHRILAIRRGEKEEVLSLRVQPPEEEAVFIVLQHVVKGKGMDAKQVEIAAVDAYKRLLSFSLETEYRLDLKRRADGEAIEVFKNNLRQLLMAPPLGQKNVLAVDPGYRTGCKIVSLDRQGNLLNADTIYLMDDEGQQKATETIKGFLKKYAVEVIAIGNGTASRETEAFFKKIDLSAALPIIMVNESGASIYSASQVARDEFPDQDVTVRGSVSIGRRLMDPLAELVKIDPQSIGVGQYQHDVDRTLLKNSLDDVVISCVNQVGVELNTASKQLLMYVAGVGPTRAAAIIEYRKANGPFRCREDLSCVKGLGLRAVEQAAGFLRIHNGTNPLDASAVHPESYRIIEIMARDLNCTILDLMKDENLRNKIHLEEYVTDRVGMPTLTDILKEIAKPGRDPREPFVLFQYQEGVATLEDLRPGMKLPGVVTNITAFGAFVDIGVHHDGLIHISQLSDRYIKSPYDVVKVYQKVEVEILEVDLKRKRIALTMRKNRR